MNYELCIMNYQKMYNIKDVFQPRIIECLKNYGKQQFSADMMAGVIVGIVAIPLAIAFGIASGVGPTEGLITAIIAGFIISAFGGTRVQIGGPTGAFIVLISEPMLLHYFLDSFNVIHLALLSL